MAKFFIDRPVFAIVIAIVTVILGAAAVPSLPIATYPEVVPPVVQVTANFRGANAQDLERTVAQPIEQQLVALDGMLYFFSRSSNDGVYEVQLRWTEEQAGVGLIRASIFTLLGEIAESSNYIRQRRTESALGVPATLTFEVVTGIVDETPFTPHGHTLRLSVVAS